LAQQQEDGSWEEDVYTTAEALLALLGHRPNLIVKSVAVDGEVVEDGEALVLVKVLNQDMKRQRKPRPGCTWKRRAGASLRTRP